MKRASAFVLIFSFLFCLCTASCNNSVDDMLDGYNGGFKKGSTSYSTSSEQSEKEDAVHQPGDTDFKADEMLYPTYTVSQNSTLNLAAPANCSSYRWKMTDPDDENEFELKIKLMTGSTITSKKYVLYVPQSGLYAGKTFKLSLTVHGNDGYDYTDVCGISVYKDYYFTSNSRSIVSNFKSETEASVSRMILPDSYSLSDSNLLYFLYAKNEITDEVYGPTRVYIDQDELDESGKVGSLLIDLPKSDYYLALFCCNSDSASTGSFESLKTSALLSGYANADLRYNNDVVFCMTSKDIISPGIASLKIFTDGWNLTSSDYSDYTASAELLSTSGETLTTCSYHIPLNNVKLPASAPVSANFVAGISAGTYMLNITFSNGTKTFSWSDNIVILAGKTTEATIGLPLIIFNDAGGG